MNPWRKANDAARPLRGAGGSFAACVALLAAVFVACSTERAAPDAPSGEHPPGWVDKASPDFHATWLKTSRFPLSRCQACHGDDYGGGAVGVSCSQGSCHAQGPPSTCTTCHGSNGTPRPATGAHAAHVPYCDTCHQVPTPSEVEKHASGDATTLVRFSGLAVSGARAPTWDPNAKKCAFTYCHGAVSPAWTDPAQIACDSCHGAPPGSHRRWARLITSTDSCTTCHPGPTDPRHHDGKVDLTEGATCTTCHGGDGHPNPPVALDGTTATTSRGVGAHARHLDVTLPDRIRRAVTCDTCHDVPSNVRDPGHLDGAQTRVRFATGGAYDATSQTCTVGCHFDRTPGPVWTNATGSARACDACHAFPPVKTRKGTPHPSVAADAAICPTCHVFGPTTHVDGVVELVQ